MSTEACDCYPTAPPMRRAHWVCEHGTYWKVREANDIFTDGPILAWAKRDLFMRRKPPTARSWPRSA